MRVFKDGSVGEIVRLIEKILQECLNLALLLGEFVGAGPLATIELLELR